MYCFKSRVRYSECNANAKITLPALVNYLQDCCTFQSEDLGVGVDYLKEHHAAWVLSSWQIEVVRYPKMGEMLSISTWPYDFKGFYGFRNFKIEDETGELLAYANSIWVYLDTESGRPMRIPQEMVSAYSYEEPFPMEKAPRKMKLPEELIQKEPFPVQKFHIDTNNHVNNEKYILMALEYVKEQVKIESVRVEYRKAAVLGDTIYPYVFQKDEKVVVALGNEAEEPYAVVDFKVAV